MAKGRTSTTSAFCSMSTGSLSHRTASQRSTSGRTATRSTSAPDFASFHHLYEERSDQLWQFLLLVAPKAGDVPPLYARTWFEFATKLCRHRRRPGHGFPAELYRIACTNVVGAWRATAPARRSAGHMVLRDANGPDWLQKVQQALLATLVEHNGLQAWQAARIVQVDDDRARAMTEASARQDGEGGSLAARVREQSLQQAGSTPHKSLEARVLTQARDMINAPPAEGGGVTRRGGALLRRAAIFLVVVGLTGVAVTWAAMTLAGRPDVLAEYDPPAGAVGAGLTVEELFVAVERADRAGDYNRVAQLSAALDARLGHTRGR